MEFNVKFQRDVCGEPLFRESHLDPITVQLHIGDVDATHGKSRGPTKVRDGKSEARPAWTAGRSRWSRWESELGADALTA